MNKFKELFIALLVLLFVIPVYADDTPYSSYEDQSITLTIEGDGTVILNSDNTSIVSGMQEEPVISEPVEVFRPVPKFGVVHPDWATGLAIMNPNPTTEETSLMIGTKAIPVTVAGYSVGVMLLRDLVGEGSYMLMLTNSKLTLEVVRRFTAND